MISSPIGGISVAQIGRKLAPCVLISAFIAAQM
jgi:hypothetical protein